MDDHFTIFPPHLPTDRDSETSCSKSALICVTYGDNWSKLSITLNSIFHKTVSPFHLFLIDNASRGETLKLYSMPDLPNTTIIRNPQNIWWGGGINQGIKLALQSEFEYLFFLNDDIELPYGWLIHMTKILSENRQIGALGPLNSSPQDWQGYDNVRSRHKELNLSGLETIDRLDLPAMNQAVRDQGKRYCYINGMLAFFCVGFRREIIEKVGLLDSDFFPLMCGDDNAYCQEILKAGYKLALSLELYVLHHSGYSIGTISRDQRKKQKETAIRLLKEKYPEYYSTI